MNDLEWAAVDRRRKHAETMAMLWVIVGAVGLTSNDSSRAFQGGVFLVSIFMYFWWRIRGGR